MTQLELTDRFVRATDPSTSIAAAVKASRASAGAVEHVRELMHDQVPRTDQEIRASLRARGIPGSLSLWQHARKALVDAAVLVDTGETRPTEDGCESRVWVRR